LLIHRSSHVVPDLSVRQNQLTLARAKTTLLV
jgi:hypothetical protein